MELDIQGILPWGITQPPAETKTQTAAKTERSRENIQASGIARRLLARAALNSQQVTEPRSRGNGGKNDGVSIFSQLQSNNSNSEYVEILEDWLANRFRYESPEVSAGRYWGGIVDSTESGCVPKTAKLKTG